VQARQEADCPHSLESLEPSNLTRVLFITDEELSDLFLRLNESLGFTFVQLGHQQADVGRAGCRASLKTAGRVQFLEPVPKSALPVHFLMNHSWDVNDIEKPG